MLFKTNMPDFQLSKYLVTVISGVEGGGGPIANVYFHTLSESAYLC